MTRPTQVRVLGKNWKIEYVDYLTNDEGETIHGHCYETDLTIKICNDQASDLALHTLLHEITHAVDYGMDLKLTERQVDLVSGGLLAVIKDNPAFAEHLIGL